MLTITSLFHHDHHLDGVVHRGRVDPQLYILSTVSALDRLNSALQSQPHLLPAIFALHHLVNALPLPKTTLLAKRCERDQPPHQLDRLSGLLCHSWQASCRLLCIKEKWLLATKVPLRQNFEDRTEGLVN